MCEVWRAEENMPRWRPHLSWSYCVCWQVQSGRHLAFLRQLLPSSKCLSSGFGGPQKQRVTSLYFTWHHVYCYLSGLRLQGPVASRGVMKWYFIPGLGLRHLVMEPALVVADSSQEQKQQPPGWPVPSCSGSCSSTSQLQTAPPDLQMIL